MERILVINGCSHSAGSETEAPGIGDSAVCRQLSFGSVLAERLNRKPVHLSYPGGSNDRIARTTTAWIGDNLERIKNKELDVLFLIHWTSAERSEYLCPIELFGEPDHSRVLYVDYSGDEQYRLVTSQTPVPKTPPLSDLDKTFKTQFVNSLPHWSDNKIKNIIYLQGVLKSFGLPYWFGDSFYLRYFETETFKSIKNLIDTRYFPYYNERDLSYYWLCVNAGYKNQSDKIWHLNADAHRYYADWLLNELAKVNLNE